MAGSFKLTAALLLALIFSAPSLSADAAKTYRWHGVSFHYPQGWTLEEGEVPNENYARLQLLSDSTPPVSLLLNLSKDGAMQGGTPDQSGKIGQAFCLPMALQLAGDVAERIYHMPSRIQVSGSTMKSVIIVVEREAKGQQIFSSMHCYAGMDSDRVAFGAIVFGGVRGRVMEEASFHRATEQAYDIVDSIRFD